MSRVAFGKRFVICCTFLCTFLACIPICSGSWPRCSTNSGWKFLERNKISSRNVHWWRYEHETLAHPALVALGPQAKSILIFGGADGGVAAQFLKSPQVEHVTLVTSSRATKVAKVSRKCFPSAYNTWRDPRLIFSAVTNPLAWLRSGKSGGLPDDLAGKVFDIIVFDVITLNAEHGSKTLERFMESGTDPFIAVHLESMVKLLAPHGLLVTQVGFLCNLRPLQLAYEALSKNFKAVWTLQFSAPDMPRSHAVGFVAGFETNLLEPKWAWWRSAAIRTVLFSEEYHSALLTPSLMLSKALGLKVPSVPDLEAANRRDISIQPIPAGGHSCQGADPEDSRFSEHRLVEKTKYQKLEIGKPGGDNVIMYLDGELQLTSKFGDFYHEALVHPVMASLGRRGRRALVIGAGDGGVATALLRYPDLEEVTQVEIDERVVDAARTHFPSIAKGYADPRHRLIIADAVQWVKDNSEKLKGIFDICIIDSTDEPLNSPWDRKFFSRLKELLTDHGAVVQNINSHTEEISRTFLKVHRDFGSRFLVSCNTPDYPSPYLLAILTEGLDPLSVDWSWWSSLNISTIYYHPTLHAALLSAPLESTKEYIKGEGWSNVHDATWSVEEGEEL